VLPRYTSILRGHAHLPQSVRQTARKGLKQGEAGDVAAERTFEALRELAGVGVGLVGGGGAGVGAGAGAGAGGAGMRRHVTTSALPSTTKQVRCRQLHSAYVDKGPVLS
jgi:hypothetical protein